MSMITIPRKTTTNQNSVETLTVNAATAAKMIGISSRLLWEKTKAGEVPCIRIGRKLLYSRQKLQAFVNGELDPKTERD